MENPKNRENPQNLENPDILDKILEIINNDKSELQVNQISSSGQDHSPEAEEAILNQVSHTKEISIKPKPNHEAASEIKVSCPIEESAHQSWPSPKT